MPFDAPFLLGPFTVDETGRLAPRDPRAMPAFLFRWRGRVVRARLGQEGECGFLTSRLMLGRVPSTAGALDPASRPRSFGLLHWLPHSLPAGWRLQLLADHRVLLEARLGIDLPITATGLLGRLAGFLLDLSPYLDLVEELGMASAEALAETGMAKTCPG